MKGEEEKMGMIFLRISRKLADKEGGRSFFRHGLTVVASARGHVGWEFGAQFVRRRGFAGTAEVKTEVAAQSNILLQRTDRQPRERLVLDSSQNIILVVIVVTIIEEYSIEKFSFQPPCH